jgi:hypothetical protein
MVKQFILLSILVCVVSACASSLDASYLPGFWKTVEWKVVSSGQVIDNQMDFLFTTNDRYAVDYGSQREKGSFYLAGEYLHTKEDGALEKSVRVTKLTMDSMIFEMNRAGSIEVVTLIKVPQD